MLTKLFTAFVCPTLEYSNVVWGPFFVLDQRKVEKVQRRATCLLPSLRDKPYKERLAALQPPSLAHRCHRGDMILLYKIINNYFNSDFSTLYTYSDTTITRGYQLKLFKCHSRLKYFLLYYCVQIRYTGWAFTSTLIIIIIIIFSWIKKLYHIIKTIHNFSCLIVVLYEIVCFKVWDRRHVINMLSTCYQHVINISIIVWDSTPALVGYLLSTPRPRLHLILRLITMISYLWWSLTVTYVVTHVQFKHRSSLPGNVMSFVAIYCYL